MRTIGLEGHAAMPELLSGCLPHLDAHVRVIDQWAENDKRPCKDAWLLLASRVVRGSFTPQAGGEGAEQGFAASARVVHELEKAEIKIPCCRSSGERAFRKWDLTFPGLAWFETCR